jgi:hypothetical protein
MSPTALVVNPEMSFMTFRERRIVVAVMSNSLYADTSALALKVATAFAEQSARSRIHGVQATADRDPVCILPMTLLPGLLAHREPP